MGLAALFVTIPATFSALVLIVHRDVPPRAAILTEGLIWYFWALVTPAIFAAVRRYPIDAPPRRRAIAAHIAFGVLAGFGVGLTSVTLYAFAGFSESGIPQQFQLASILLWVPFGVLFYGMIATVGFAIDYHRKLREREQATAELKALLVESRLGALRMQLQPHFLFNALNTVAMLVRQGDAQTSVRVLARLAELLRQVLDEEAAQEVALGDELDLVGRYLDIERVRFGDRLHVLIEADAAARASAVPHLLLQPLVENAVRHGISRRADAGTIQVRADRRDGTLRVRVRDDGPGLAAHGEAAGDGIGLRNTRARLRYLYGDAASLELLDHVDGGAEVTVVLPAREIRGG